VTPVSFSRRAFFERALSLAALRAGVARAQSTSAPADLFDIEKTADGVWLALARPSILINSNAAIFELAEGLLVVDTHSKPSAAASLVAQIRRDISAKPVRYVVNTHFHYDHAHGNAAYRQLRPRVDILATATTRSVLAERGAKAITASVESMRRTLEQARKQLRGAATPQEKIFYERSVKEAEAYIREMRGALPELPDLTFEDRMVLHDRKQELHLVFRGRAHTESDICVVSPSRRLAATGDLVSGFIPGMGDGFPAEWPATLRSLAEIEFDLVLPGHGSLQTSKGRLEQLRAYIEEVNEAVLGLKREGRSLDEVRRAVTAGALKTVSGDWGRYVAEMTGRYRWIAPGAGVWKSIEDGVQGNVTAIYEKS
jgi:glyoxylase-like metal-dependent hydrolase (beta-lactamase superfamily II)